MSRLIVRGLPSRCTDTQLKKDFGSFGTITDCSLKYTKDGKFRRMAFIGFNDESEADAAIKYYNGAYMGTSKLIVEICRPFGDSSKPRPWSKYAPGSSAHNALISEDDPSNQDQQQSRKRKAVSEDQQENNLDEKPKKSKKKDAKFDEFLKLHGTGEEEPGAEESAENTEISTDSLVPQLFEGITGDLNSSVVICGLPASIKQTSVKQFLAPVKPKVMRVVRNDNEAAALVTFARKPDQRRVVLRNNEFLGGFKLTITEAESHQPKNPNANKPRYQKVDQGVLAAEIADNEQTQTELILDTGRLFIRNLSYTTTLEDLKRLFDEFGPTVDVNLIVDRDGKPKGFALVTYMFPEHAVNAYTKLDGSIFKGRMLHIIGGREAKNTTGAAKPGATTDDAKSSFKKEKEAKQKSTSTSAHNWNTLFLGGDAVADMIASKLNTDKGTLLDAEGDGSLAVRMALAETRLVRETREFLMSNGVQLDSFSRPAAKRSTTVIIAKNLPAGTTSDKLRPVFERFGQLGRFVLPPEGGMSALIEFATASEASIAFKALAYSRFGPAPLYLEWAPGDVFGADAIAANQAQLEEEANGPTKKKKSKKSKKHDKIDNDDEETETITTKSEDTQSSSKSDAEPLDEENDAPEPDTTIFVKNLNFETTDDTLVAKFAKIGRVCSATVSKKRDPSHPDRQLSMGFGFVQYYRQQDTQQALKLLQGALLNGHSLELKLSNRKVAEAHPDMLKRKAVTNTEQGDSVKILVRNVPFQASKKDIVELFGAFGELSFARLPKKVTGGGDSGSGKQHRGFAFVQFMSKEDAGRAFAALCHSTHLYGRRLVLEWSHDDADMEVLRAKTAEHFATGADRKKVGKQKKQLKEALEHIEHD